MESEKNHSADKRTRGKQPKAATWANTRSENDGNMLDYLATATINKHPYTVVSIPKTPIHRSQNPPDQEFFTDYNSKLLPGNKKRKMPHQLDYDASVDSMTPPITTLNLAGKLDIIINKLDDQSQELAAIRKTQSSQTIELSNIKKLTSALSARVTTLEEDVGTLMGERNSASSHDHPSNTAFVQQLESQDKLLRKNNIIISGLVTDVDNCLHQTRNFIENRFHEGGAVQDAYHINNNMNILAKIATVGAKEKIMANKTKALVNTRIFISKDQTLRERKIAYLIRSKVREGKAKGIFIKTGYQMYCLNGTWYHWSDADNDFVVDAQATSTSPTAASQPEPLQGPFYRNGYPGLPLNGAGASGPHPKNVQPPRSRLQP